MSLRVVPLELTEANAVVAVWHRHHKPVVGHRFSIGAIDENRVIHGAAIIGRPVSQHSGPPRAVVEVTRLVTDGTPNACSILYAAAARAARNLGYHRIQTFILASEPGTSLKASGWVNEGETGGNSWGHRPGREAHTLGVKTRWALVLNPVPIDQIVFPETDSGFRQETLL